MKPETMRRAVAAASAAVMAGAGLVVGGAGVASAEPVSASDTFSGAASASFRIDRTVSDASPTYGDVVSVRTHVERTGIIDLLYGVRSDVPSCFERVVGTTNGQARGGNHISEPHRQFSFSGDRVGWTGPGVGPWFWMETDYRVLCDAGSIPTGGAEFASIAGVYRGSMSLGPTINVQRKGTSVLLHLPSSAQVGQEVDLKAVTTNIPDGSQVTFTVDGQTIGSDTVDGGTATVQWTPDAEGPTEISANFAQTGTHGASSQTRTATVSPTNEDSQVEVAASGSPKVGESTDLIATVTPAGAGGTVVFRVNNSVVGQSPVQANGTAITDWIPQSAGQHTVDADFSGRPGVNPSSGAASVTVAEADSGAEATTTTLDSIPTTPAGEEITLRAEVAPSNATGTVSFYDGQTPIGTADVNDGVATLQWTPDESGSYTIRARFTSEDDFLSSQGARQVTITPGIVDPEPDPDPTEPTDPGTGSLGSLTGSLGGNGDSGSLGSLSDLGS